MMFRSQVLWYQTLLDLTMCVGFYAYEQIMRRIAGSYVYWYNWKYDRIGNLFQDRFKSEPVEDNTYFLTVLRYSHQNPIKAGVTKDIKNYKWSSYKEYLEGKGLTDREYVLEFFHKDPSIALGELVKYSDTLNEDKCLEIDENQKS
ncbi:conserved hypothetical protein [Alkaliphilus metalliredigens QYMF]|uniref:Transposase and inactivated derivatives-like protein n=1 Tax=Alkaliphilus metalliredigens (strain QYMF) TaxID=293826 RepID=A6TJJ2_ALKMQ|nr:hypothetical protein [Alkaliphilus metalliredigens]ABR46360.1 conserved hypothetical protein [Alkaliphilus metalliredigens QYMF]